MSQDRRRIAAVNPVSLRGQSYSSQRREESQMGRKKKAYRRGSYFQSVVWSKGKRHAAPHLIQSVRVVFCTAGLMITAIFVAFINLF